MRPGSPRNPDTTFEDVKHVLDTMIERYNKYDRERIDKAKEEYDRYRRRCDEEPGYEE